MTLIDDEQICTYIRQLKCLRSTEETKKVFEETRGISFLSYMLLFFYLLLTKQSRTQCFVHFFLAIFSIKWYVAIARTHFCG